jgi:hypothetical protein
MGHRWVAELADFNISNIHYKPGPTNTAADALSRLPLDVEKYMASCTMTTEKEQMLAGIGSQSGREEVDQVWVNCLLAEIVSDLESQAKSMVAIETLSKSQVQEAQMEDPELSKVINWCKGKKKPPQHQLRQESPTVKAWLRDWGRLKIDDHGILQRSCQLVDGSTVSQLCLPRKYRQMVYKQLHEEMGHPGPERVTALARDRFHWPVW